MALIASGRLARHSSPTADVPGTGAVSSHWASSSSPYLRTRGTGCRPASQANRRRSRSRSMPVVRGFHLRYPSRTRNVSPPSSLRHSRSGSPPADSSSTRGGTVTPSSVWSAARWANSSVIGHRGSGRRVGASERITRLVAVGLVGERPPPRRRRRARSRAGVDRAPDVAASPATPRGSPRRTRRRSRRSSRDTGTAVTGTNASSTAGPPVERPHALGAERHHDQPAERRGRPRGWRRRRRRPARRASRRSPRRRPAWCPPAARRCSGGSRGSRRSPRGRRGRPPRASRSSSRIAPSTSTRWRRRPARTRASSSGVSR